MANTLELLKLHPEAALRAIISEKMKSGRNVQALKMTGPNGTGLTTTVTLEVDRGVAGVEYWPYVDPIVFTYQRLDMAELFSGLDLSFTVDFPTKASEVIRLLSRRFYIYFDDKDYVERDIYESEEGNVVIEARSESWRWIGQMSVDLKLRIKSLAEGVRITKLDAISYPKVGLVERPGREMLLESINRLNTNWLRNHPIDLVTSSIENMVALTNPNDPYDRTQTKATLKTKSTNKYYTGELDITYTRRDMLKTLGDDAVRITDADVQTTRELAILVAERMGIYLNPNDIIDTALPAIAPGGTRVVTCFVNDNSWMYVGEMTVQLTRPVSTFFGVLQKSDYPADWVASFNTSNGDSAYDALPTKLAVGIGDPIIVYPQEPADRGRSVKVGAGSRQLNNGYYLSVIYDYNQVLSFIVSPDARYLYGAASGQERTDDAGFEAWADGLGSVQCQVLDKNGNVIPMTAIEGRTLLIGSNAKVGNLRVWSFNTNLAGVFNDPGLVGSVRMIGVE